MTRYGLATSISRSGGESDDSHLIRAPRTVRGAALGHQIHVAHDPDGGDQQLPQPPFRVLVVDDDADIRDLVSLALLDEGYEVVAAANGAQALERVRGCFPDVILLDMQMPEMDGPTFARRYREEPGPHAPIVVFTAAGRAGEWANALQAAAIVEKPFDLDTLPRVLASCIRGAAD